MPNYTLEYHYKEAVKKKYEEVKNGVNFIYLDKPTRGKLRTLCGELFESQNMHPDDLIVFNSLLGFPFDLNTRNKFRKHSNEFRPIETFFTGKTDPLNIEVVNMAAILVDYPLRPFNKFRIQRLYEDENQTSNDSELSNSENKQVESSGDLEIFIEEKEKEKGVFEVRQSTPEVISSFADVEEKPKEQEEQEELKEQEEQEELTELKEQEEGEEKKLKEEEEEKEPEKPKEPWKIPRINWKYAVMVASIFLFVGFVVVFFAFPNKDCMQWSGDHYEIVDCELKIQSTGTFNNIEILDPTLINLKKVKVCDTTTCFDKNGVAIIWYAKTANGVDFFNIHGRHPENNHPLRPVTRYILGKYVKR